MDIKKLASASAATLLAIGLAVVLVPEQSGISGAAKWRLENHHTVGTAAMPATAARGVRNLELAGQPAIQPEDQVSYIRRPAPAF